MSEITFEWADSYDSKVKAPMMDPDNYVNIISNLGLSNGFDWKPLLRLI
jgi:hypothetical protein